MAEPQTAPLRGRRLLVVEDEYVMAKDLTGVLEDEGVEVVGPAATLDQALALIASGAVIDGAVLDINLRGKKAFPIADALRGRGVPFVFATGYDAFVIPAIYKDVPHLEKPVDMRALVRALARL